MYKRYNQVEELPMWNVTRQSALFQLRIHAILQSYSSYASFPPFCDNITEWLARFLITNIFLTFFSFVPNYTCQKKKNVKPYDSHVCEWEKKQKITFNWIDFLPFHMLKQSTSGYWHTVRYKRVFSWEQLFSTLKAVLMSTALLPTQAIGLHQPLNSSSDSSSNHFIPESFFLFESTMRCFSLLFYFIETFFRVRKYD